LAFKAEVPERPMTPHDSKPQIASARPEMTRAIMAETGLDELVLHTLVERFYGKVREDEVLGPIFEARISDWAPHLDRMVDFWSSVALMTGRYHGAPVPAHTGLPVDAAHFERWLGLFRETASEVCSPEGAEHVICRAERIARSLRMAVEDAQRSCPAAVPALG
jgi:hemoglobin